VLDLERLSLPGSIARAVANTNTNPRDPTNHSPNWTALGSVTEASPGMYRFVDIQATNISQRFYRIVAP
jgi:hypothetical protein